MLKVIKIVGRRKYKGRKAVSSVPRLGWCFPASDVVASVCSLEHGWCIGTEMCSKPPFACGLASCGFVTPHLIHTPYTIILFREAFLWRFPSKVRDLVSVAADSWTWKYRYDVQFRLASIMWTILRGAQSSKQRCVACDAFTSCLIESVAASNKHAERPLRTYWKPTWFKSFC